MTQSLEALTQRKTSMQGIRGVVHTMKTLSVINAAPYEHAARSIGAYHDTVLEGLHAFLAQSGPVQTETPHAVAKVMVVFGSDHGLCGNYNEALAAYVRHSAVSDDITAQAILCVGAQMQDALVDQGLEVEEVFFPPASVDGIGRLANLLTETLDRIREDSHPNDISVRLANSTRQHGGTHGPEISTLLPLDPMRLSDLQARPWLSRSRPFISMPGGDLFSALIREHLFASLFRAAAEAMVTENAARLALMQQAEQSVDDRLEDLMSQTRTLRQTDITTELLDVIIGFEALKADTLAKRAAKITKRPI